MLHIELPEYCSRVLLHSCCAPCSGAILECMLANGIRPVVFFSNSNIAPRAEYEKRLGELLRYAESLGVETVIDSYDHDDWLDCVMLRKDGRVDGQLARCPERGARCLECFRYRLRRAALFAVDNGFDALTTTLASSRWKDLDQVNSAGREAVAFALARFADPASGADCPFHAARAAVSSLSALPPQYPAASIPEAPLSGAPSLPRLVFWEQNWRKGGLQPRRGEIVREQNFYNQNYCGCEFSERHSV